MLKNHVVSVLCAGLLVLLSSCAADCADAVRNALQLCIFSVVPSLFPFFAVSSLAVSCGLAHDLGRLCAPLMRTVFHLPGCGAAALILGFLGGYPSGVRMASACFHAGLCSEQQAQDIACVCNNTGPAFLIGMCGGGLFGSVRIGVFLYGIHVLSALTAAYLLRPKTCPHEDTASLPAPVLSFSRALIDTVRSAGVSCLMVSAFVLFFSVILQLLQKTAVLHTISMIAAPYFSCMGLTAQGTQSFLCGLIELTQGLSGLTSCAGTTVARLTAVCFLCAFGGISVLFQTAAAAQPLHISRCIGVKCLHALLAAVFCMLFLHICPNLLH